VGPVHDVLPFAWVVAAFADVVFDGVGGMGAFEVFDLLVDDQVVLLIDLLDAEDHDVGGEGDDLAEGVGGFDVGVGGGNFNAEDAEGAEKEVETISTDDTFHDRLRYKGSDADRRGTAGTGSLP